MKIRLEQYKLVYIELQILQVSLEVSFIMLKIEIKKAAKIMCVVLLWFNKLFYSQSVK